MPPGSAGDRVNAPERCAGVSWSLLVQWMPYWRAILSVERCTRCNTLRATTAKQARATVRKVQSIPGSNPAD